MSTFNMLNLLSRQLFHHWAHRLEEYQTAWEGTVSVQLGPFYLERNDAYVLDHSDLYLSITLPLPRWKSGNLGRLSAGHWQRHILQLGFRACRGEEQVRQAGFELVWRRPYLD